MTPFADEQYIQSDMCHRGQVWQREILKSIVQKGTLYNACTYGYPYSMLTCACGACTNRHYMGEWCAT